MAEPADAWSADRLCALLEATRAACNRMLDELARRRRPEAICAACPPFRYVPARGRPGQAIPAEAFHRPYALVLESLELTLEGYCLPRRTLWRRRGAVFVLGRPPLWRRVLRLAPLLALRVRVADGRASVGVGSGSGRLAAPGVAPLRILLPPDLQDALLRLHRRRIARNRHETDFSDA